MAESEADIMGDEEVKVQDEGATARALEAGVADMTWDPEDPPVSMPVKEVMPDLKDSSFKEPQAEDPQVEIPPVEMHQVTPWVHFKAQICQDEV